MVNTDRDDKIGFEGVVVASNKGIFKVEVTDNHVVVCTIAGRLKINEIKVMVGDWVAIEVSPYFMERGRICKRLKRAGSF